MSCVKTFVRGSIEYECEDISELPACVNDLDHPSAQSFENINLSAYDSHINFDIKKAIVMFLRIVKHLKWVINMVD